MDRDQKKEFVAELHQRFGEVSTVVVTHYKGMTVAELSKLRRQMGAAGAEFRVTKNRLTRLALAGTKFEGLSDLFTGPTGIAISADPVAAAKVVDEFAKTNPKLVVLGGGMDETVLDPAGVKALASMPSLDELRARLVGLISTPAQRIATILQQPGGQIARVLKAYADKSEAA